MRAAKALACLGCAFAIAFGALLLPIALVGSYANAFMTIMLGLAVALAALVVLCKPR